MDSILGSLIGGLLGGGVAGAIIGGWIKHGRPAALGVITGWGYGYRRPDGVAVIPIGALAP